jgi:Uncharacterized protein conserved in bacteria
MGQHLKQLELNNIKITDDFFGKYVRCVGEKIISHQWKILNDCLEGTEPTYCIRNFRIAAGEIEGTRQGIIYQDTDLYKWLESVAFHINSECDSELEKQADEVIDLLSRAQEKDGYLNTYYTVNEPDKKWTNLIEAHELYTAGHMIEAAVAYYKATGKDAFLNIAKKNADLIYQVFGEGEGQIKGYPGHEEIELALIKLYRVTNEKRYLELARYFLMERGKAPSYFEKEQKTRKWPEFSTDFANYDLKYSQSNVPVKELEKVEGHAVRMMYLCAAMADLAEEDNDSELLSTCQRIWQQMTHTSMYITGGVGSSGYRESFSTDYDLPNKSSYAETCASIGLMMFGQRMTSLTKNAKYYDDVERALYNTVLAGINLAGDKYFYVNPLEVVPEFCTAGTYMKHVKAERQEWFFSACCPPNVARTLASLGQYIYAKDDEALYVHQFISSQAKAKVGMADIEIDMNSELLSTGKVTMTIEATESTKLKIRIPHYATVIKICMDGVNVDIPQKDGYFVIDIKSGKTSSEIDFGVKARWVAANAQVRNDIGKAALMKGPLVYCLEEIDNGKNLAEIYIAENVAVTPEKVEELPDINIDALKYQGFRLKNRAMNDEQLYGDMELEQMKVDLKAIPYCLWNNRGNGEMLVWQKVTI